MFHKNNAPPFKPMLPPSMPRLNTNGYEELFGYIEHLAGRRLYQYEATVIKTLIEAEKSAKIKQPAYHPPRFAEQEMQQTDDPVFDSILAGRGISDYPSKEDFDSIKTKPVPCGWCPSRRRK